MVKKLILILILTTIAFLIFYLSITFFVATQVIQPNRDPIEIPPQAISENFEEIIINTSSGEIHGWLFNSSSEKLIIMVPGYKQNRVNNSYFGSLISKELINQGYNVLMYDNQATGQSSGSNITFGLKESNDLIKIVDHAVKKGFISKHIAILGDEMGATTALLASDKLKDIGTIIVDTPSKNVKLAVSYLLQKESNVPAFLNPGIFSWLKYFYNIDLDKIKPTDHILNAPERKFLFLHGELDKKTSPSNSESLINIANPESEILIFPGSEHIEGFKNNKELYLKTVLEFLADNL